MKKTQEMVDEGNQLRDAMIEDDERPTFNNVPPVVPPIVPPSNNGSNYNGDNNDDVKRRLLIEELSVPQMNQPYDILPLPSEGKLYGLNKKTVKVAYLTTADENILTSPNLVTSGDFLEILINRKLLEPSLRYKDLIPGDRNAIMIWLRATGYGEMYPVTIYDNDGDAFDTEINLSDLKIDKLNVDPNENGLFEFLLPVSKNLIKFKMLTVGDIESIDNELGDIENELINVSQTIILERQIVDINGNTDKAYIKDYVNNMRVLDAQKLREYINTINCGIDLTINVTGPKGDTVNTLLPLTSRFFWPNS
jgi:hypothetical protein